MKKSILLLLLSPLLIKAQSPVDSRKQEIVIRSVNVVPMNRETILENYDVVIKDGVVRAMGPSQSIMFDNRAILVDGKGKYLIPGLAEMHAHVPPIDDINPMKEVLMLYALNGITTIRGMLGHPKHLELRKKIADGEIMGPPLYTSGPSFNGTTVKTAEEGLQLAERELEQAQRRYKAGVTNSVEVTDAQTRLERARDNRIAALFNHNLARLDLGAALGTVDRYLP